MYTSQPTPVSPGFVERHFGGGRLCCTAYASYPWIPMKVEKAQTLGHMIIMVLTDTSLPPWPCSP